MAREPDERVEPDQLLTEAVDATRRTHLANERTQLAWWRTGLTALAVALGVGRVVPELAGGGAHHRGAGPRPADGDLDPDRLRAPPSQNGRRFPVGSDSCS